MPRTRQRKRPPRITRTSLSILVVFYSRTGRTAALAGRIAAAAKADVEEIRDLADRKGWLGYLRSGNEASFRRRARILAASKDPAGYDLVVIGTPVWRGCVSSPVRTYLEDSAARLRRVAFFCTMDRSGAERAFRQMQRACGEAPLATLAASGPALRRYELSSAVAAFAASLQPPTAIVRPARAAA